MKIFFITILCMTSSLGSFAQYSEEPSAKLNDKNVRKLSNYPINSSVQVLNNLCIISYGKTSDTIALKPNGKINLLTVTVATDTNKIDLLQLNDAHKQALHVQYDSVENNKYKGLSLLEKLLNRAKDIDAGGSIKFVGDGKTNSSDSNMPTESENYVDPSIAAKEQKNGTNMLYLIIGLLSAAVIGLLAKLFSGKKVPSAADPAKEKGAIVDAINATQLQASNVQLQATNDALLSQMKLLQAQFNEIKDADAAYFEGAKLELVNPMLHALNKNKKEEILSIAMQIVLQYIAITRVKNNNYEGSDLYNVERLKGNANDALNKAQRSVNQQTPADQIPTELKAIVQLLNDNQISIPQGLAFAGYVYQ
jgi:hypothetical protein